MTTTTTSAADRPSLPLIIEAGRGSGNDASPEGLVAWYCDHADGFEQALLRHGAVLFRGFHVNNPAALLTAARAQCPQLRDYVDGNSPRTKLSNDVYTSTEYPPEDMIWLHNELSYSHQWPTRLFLSCVVAAAEGGETPVADGRHLLRALPPDIVETFAAKGVAYVRNLHGGLGVGPSWQETFETDDPRTAERHLGGGGAEFAWQSDGSLRIIQKRPAIIVHPVTGETVWFNQADQFHPSGLRADAYEAMMTLFEGNESNLPINATFGDGSPIDAGMLASIRNTALREATVLPWRAGDLMVVDNVLTLHGRRPYRGPRQVLVCMA